MPLNPRLRAPLAGLVVAAIAAIALGAGVAQPLSRGLFDGYQRLHPRDLSGTSVHVVWIDEDSLTGIAPWPWPRYFLAELTRAIAAQQPRAIGFDILFNTPDMLRPDYFLRLNPAVSPSAAEELRTIQNMDVEFAREIGASPTVLARLGTDLPSPSRQGPLPIETIFAAPLPKGLPAFASAIASIPDLDEVALGHGIINGEPDGDGLVRRLPMAAIVEGQPTAGFALELARVAAQVDEVTPLIERGRLRGIELGGRIVPTDSEGRMRLHLGLFPADRISSALDILRGAERPDLLRDRTVIVGLAAEGTSDIVATPLQKEVFGLFVQAQGVDAILRGGWLHRPTWAPLVEWALAAVLVSMTLSLIPARRAWWSDLPVATLFVLLVSSWLAFRYWALLLDPIPALILVAAAAGGAMAMSYRDTRAERERLSKALLAEQLSAAEAAGELQAARDIQLGMLPPRKALAAFDPRIDFDALLEPARSVGGDFYDAQRIDADRIGFAIGDVTGKGLPAALFMALSKALARSALLRGDGDLAATAAMLDEELARERDGDMGVTMVIGVIDVASGWVSLMNAGHDNPVQIAVDGGVSDVPMEGGPPFCTITGFPYPAEPLRLGPGETLVLVTDGISEAQDPGGALFGRGRLRAALEGGGEARQMTERLLLEVRAFEAGAVPSDDLTVLAIRYVGGGA